MLLPFKFFNELNFSSAGKSFSSQQQCQNRQKCYLRAFGCVSQNDQHDQQYCDSKGYEGLRSIVGFNNYGLRKSITERAEGSKNEL